MRITLQEKVNSALRICDGDVSRAKSYCAQQEIRASARTWYRARETYRKEQELALGRLQQAQESEIQ